MPAGVIVWKKSSFFQTLDLEDYLELGAHIWREVSFYSEKLKNELDLWKSEFLEVGEGGTHPTK